MIIYAVKNGEAVADIAARFNTSIRRINADNGLLPRLKITEGQELIISSPKSIYTASSSDTVKSISEMFSIDKETLLRSNPGMLSDEKITTGDEIVLDSGEYRFGEIEVIASLKPAVDKRVTKRIMPYLTYVSLRSCIVRSDGSVYMQNDSEMRSLAREYKVAPVLEIQANVNDNKEQFLISENMEAISRIAHNIKQTTLSNGYVGVNLNLGEIPSDRFESFSELVSTLKEMLDPWSVFVMVSVPESAVILDDIELLCDGVDKLTLFPKSSKRDMMDILEIEDVCHLITEVVDPHKLSMSVPMSALDSTYSLDGELLRLERFSSAQAVRLAMERSCAIEYDASTCLSGYNFLDLERGAFYNHKVEFQGLEGLFEILCMGREMSIPSINVFNADKFYTPFWRMLSLLYNVKKIY